MPRAPRTVTAGQPLHLIQRGNNRSACFIDDRDRAFYLRSLRDASTRTGCAIHAYVLMTNHVHLVVTPADAMSTARLMQAVGRRYVRHFNDRYDRTGTLWEGRYRSMPIDSERYFLACSRYVELNPVRAGLVRQPASYPWSSFRCNANGNTDPIVTPHAVYEALGALAAVRQASYRALFTTTLDADVVDAIRRATSAGLALGTALARTRSSRRGWARRKGV